MRMVMAVAVLATLSLVAGLSGEGSAQSNAKKLHKHAQAQVRQPSAAPTAGKPDGYVERDANKLPFGSSLWWDQMLRENRAGQCCN